MGKKSKHLSTHGPEDQGEGGDAPGRVQKPTGARTKQRRKAVGIAGVPGSKNPERRCTATVRSTGERCKRAAIKGGFVCPSHGGAAPQVQKSARERLLELADPAIAALSKIVQDEHNDDSTRLRAALGILDRTGYGPGQTVTVQTSKWDDMFEGVIGIDRSGLPESNEPAALPRGGEENPLGSEDYEQHALDAQAKAWRDFDDEDAQPYVTKLDRFGPNVVQGEVVASREDVAPPSAGPRDPRTRFARGSVAD